MDVVSDVCGYSIDKQVEDGTSFGSARVTKSRSCLQIGSDDGKGNARDHRVPLSDWEGAMSQSRAEKK